MTYLLINNSAGGNKFSNLRTAERCRKRFQEKYINPIITFTPLLPSIPQIYFLLAFILITMAIIVIAILILFQFNREVKIYFIDMTNKTKTCGVYSATSEVTPEWINEMRSSGQLTPVLLGAFPRKMQLENSNVVPETMPMRHIFHHLPSRSKNDNFTRRGTVVLMHLPFAHDLASFVAMVDGKV
ncbi:hypothetical protein TSMEX_000632 [Taenia solium]|eukprot:TsM_000999300 transcript=TsM_000999300 gene=TsM_000999300